LRLARKPQREAWEAEPCETGVYPTKNQPGHHMQKLSRLIGNRAARRPRPVCHKQFGQDQEPLHIDGLANADADAVPDSAIAVDGIDVDSIASVSNSTLRPGETQISIVNFKRRKGVSDLSIELKGDKKKKRLVSRHPVNTYTEADPDLDEADGMLEDPTAAVSNSTAEPSETQIPFVNFNRRIGVSKLSIEPKGDEKKRRLIRPSLELDDRSSQVADYFGEPLKKPSLVGTESALDGESMVVNDIMNGEAEQSSKSLEISQGSVCKSEENHPEVELVDTRHEGFQGNCEEERVLLSAIGTETERGKLDLDMSVNAESSALAFGQCRDDSSEILLFIESVNNKLKKHFEESRGRSDTYLGRVPEKSKFETRPDPQISGSEKADTSKLNKASAKFSDCHPGLLLCGEKTSVSNLDPMDSEPIFEIDDNSGLEGEPDNSKMSMSLHNKKSNLVEECIAPEPKARDLKTSPVSCKDNSNPVEKDITLKPEVGKLEMGLSSSCGSCENSKLVEDYIPLESHDENIKETVEYREITHWDYITLE
jgi:hypothetical protein